MTFCTDARLKVTILTLRTNDNLSSSLCRNTNFRRTRHFHGRQIVEHSNYCFYVSFSSSMPPISTYYVLAWSPGALRDLSGS